ncbi:type II toxin-antitoxin system death-on-curing family toxin [Mycolicibacterium poriferae]|uniref:type II toxin-antitoxin system death-on-curing family toxin n=1 Tax=Mycolicibacterium poriferae TaxID=39694 RepID=UPI0024B917C1|nr:type II toxin-antitoxin system death-on-curing family toxin [Mycolicibacterium poriferae]
MTEYLDREDVLMAGAAAVGIEVRVADYGLLDAAVARPQATAFGVDAYPDLFTKAAALLQSLARNHALVDGNKRTAWAAAWTFLFINGIELPPDFDVDHAEDFMNSVATQGDLELVELARALQDSAADKSP